jgi:hypothetical protein
MAEYYILKNPLIASPYTNDGVMAVELEHVNECLLLSDYQFSVNFRPLDIEDTRRQIRDILNDTGDIQTYNDYLTWCGLNERYARIKEHDLISRIVAVLGITVPQNKEKK